MGRLQTEYLGAMFFTRMRETPQTKVGSRIHANKSISNREGVQYIHRTTIKKLLSLSERRHWTGRKKRKKPQRAEWEEYTQVAWRKPIAWAEAEEGIEPITVEINIQGQRIQALVDSGADENYLHWKTAKQLKIQWKRKMTPYQLCGIEGKETSYNGGKVTYETRTLHM